MTAGCNCGRTWTGLSQAHCTGESVALAIGDGNASFLPKRHAHLHQAAVDDGRITPDLTSDLVGTPPGPVKMGSFLSPDHFASRLSLRPGRNTPRSLNWNPLRPSSFLVMQRVVLSGCQWTQVLRTIVGPVVIDVVNMFLGRDPVTDDSVLVDLHIRPRRNTPAQQDVTVLTEMPTRRMRRDLLTRSKRANRPALTGVLQPTVIAAPSLTSARNGGLAVDTDNGSHKLILAVLPLCHQHFAMERTAA